MIVIVKHKHRHTLIQIIFVIDSYGILICLENLGTKITKLVIKLKIKSTRTYSRKK